MRRFFSPSALQCQLFAYGGCQGNGNRFDTLEQCTGNCTGTAPTPSPPRETPPPPIDAPPASMAPKVKVPTVLVVLLDIQCAAACRPSALVVGCCRRLLHEWQLRWQLLARSVLKGSWFGTSGTATAGGASGI